MDRHGHLDVETFSKLDFYKESRPGLSAEAFGEADYVIEPDEEEVCYRDEYYVLANMGGIASDGTADIDFDTPKNHEMADH
jgi:hypothetical protein